LGDQNSSASGKILIRRRSPAGDFPYRGMSANRCRAPDQYASAAYSMPISHDTDAAGWVIAGAEGREKKAHGALLLGLQHLSAIEDPPDRGEHFVGVEGLLQKEVGCDVIAPFVALVILRDGQEAGSRIYLGNAFH